jgi:hypothetical protein
MSILMSDYFKVKCIGKALLLYWLRQGRGDKILILTQSLVVDIFIKVGLKDD